jgi:hypothetical protein
LVYKLRQDVAKGEIGSLLRRSYGGLGGEKTVSRFEVQVPSFEGYGILHENTVKNPFQYLHQSHTVGLPLGGRINPLYACRLTDFER